MREGCSALRRGSRSYFCLRRVTFFSWTRRGVPRPGAGKFLYLSPTASFLSAAKEKRKRNAAKNRSGEFLLPFSLSALADYISTDRSAMMRELKKMREEDLLSVHGRDVTLYAGI